MLECTPCNQGAVVTIGSPEDPIIYVDFKCCDQHLFTWKNYNLNKDFVIDSYCTWDDTGEWNDEFWFYESCQFDVDMTCVPQGLGESCWYDSNDVIAYTTSNGWLFGACDK